MIHTTVGVYPNTCAPFKSNGVPSEVLAQHIKYNIDNRIGRALFLDGVCIYRGNVSEEDLINVQSRVAEIKHNMDTAPYN